MPYLEGCNTNFRLSPIKKAYRDWVSSRRMGESFWIRPLAWKRAYLQKWYRAEIISAIMFCSSSEADHDIKDGELDRRKKGMLIGVSVLFRSRREEYGFTKYLKPGRGYWWIKSMKKGTLIKEL